MGKIILDILLLIFLIYMFVRIKMYVDVMINELEDYINDIRDVTLEAFEKLGINIQDKR